MKEIRQEREQRWRHAQLRKWLVHRALSEFNRSNNKTRGKKYLSDRRFTHLIEEIIDQSLSQATGDGGNSCAWATCDLNGIAMINVVIHRPHSRRKRFVER